MKSFLFHSDIHSQQFPTIYSSWLLILILGSLGSLWHQLSREGTRIWFLKPCSSVWWADKAGFSWKSWCFLLCPLIRPKEIFANILSLVVYALAFAHFCPRFVGVVKYKIRENKGQHSWEASNNYFFFFFKKKVGQVASEGKWPSIQSDPIQHQYLFILPKKSSRRYKVMSPWYHL